MDERVGVLRGSVGVQTGQSQPMTGTPTEVPVPRKVISKSASIWARGWRLYWKRQAHFARVSRVGDGEAEEFIGGKGVMDTGIGGV